MIAIIAILAGVLLPGLARAKSSALAVVCKNNLRQIGIALNNYVTDYGAYPMISEGLSVNFGRTWARGALNEYLGIQDDPRNGLGFQGWPDETKGTAGRGATIFEGPATTGSIHIFVRFTPKRFY